MLSTGIMNKKHCNTLLSMPPFYFCECFVSGLQLQNKNLWILRKGQNGNTLNEKYVLSKLMNEFFNKHLKLLNF